MKLVAASDFRNPAPDKIKVAGAVHALHIHKGARFCIGEDAPFEKLNPQEQRLVVLLNTSARIVEESQAEAVAKIDAEVKADAAKRKP